MASSKWKNWEELSGLIRGKRVVFWGASNWIERALDHIEIWEPGSFSNVMLEDDDDSEDLLTSIVI